MGRGLLGEAKEMLLCEKASEEFNAFAAISVVSLGQLYGGKLCAAVDRKHPRDIFDIDILLKNKGITKEIVQGFLLGLISGPRPPHELIKPNRLD